MVLFDHRLGVLAKRDLRVVGENDLQPRVRSRDQLVLEGNGHALCGLGAVTKVHDAHITLQALHHAHAILALRAAGLRQREDEEKRRAEEGEACDSSLTLHVESLLCHGRPPRSARTRTGADAYDNRIRPQFCMKCYCACRRHQGCHCIKGRLRYVCVFWAALGKATACLYLMMWGIGCEVQWPVAKLNLRNKRERSRLMCDHRRMLPNMSLWADLA